MTDVFDRAQAREEELRADALAAARPARRNGSDRCVDCAAVISVARHAAVPGCRRCVECQVLLEETA